MNLAVEQPGFSGTDIALRAQHAGPGKDQLRLTPFCVLDQCTDARGFCIGQGTSTPGLPPVPYFIDTPSSVGPSPSGGFSLSKICKEPCASVAPVNAPPALVGSLAGAFSRETAAANVQTPSLPAYEDPILSGLVQDMEEVRSLFDFFFNKLNFMISILDPQLHTPDFCRSTSLPLFTTILTVSSKVIRPDLYPLLVASANRQIAQAFLHGVSDVEFVQTLGISCFWRPAEDGKSWTRNSANARGMTGSDPETVDLTLQRARDATSRASAMNHDLPAYMSRLLDHLVSTSIPPPSLDDLAVAAAKSAPTPPMELPTQPPIAACSEWDPNAWNSTFELDSYPSLQLQHGLANEFHFPEGDDEFWPVDLGSSARKAHSTSVRAVPTGPTGT
ncbi:hypothetical protein P7C70_g1309, partial [Phenoliferia sp. Uapishka_3]